VLVFMSLILMYPQKRPINPCAVTDASPVALSETIPT